VDSAAKFGNRQCIHQLVFRLTWDIEVVARLQSSRFTASGRRMCEFAEVLPLWMSLFRWSDWESPHGLVFDEDLKLPFRFPHVAMISPPYQPLPCGFMGMHVAA